jgi:hypothetical protein
MSDWNGLTTNDKPSPMGWYYRIGGDKKRQNPYIDRGKVGVQWEKADVYDLAELTPDELRFIADLIEAHETNLRAMDDSRLPA